MRLYIIRHADPDYPNKTITEFGHQEARALGQRLAAEKIDRIYTSPMGRARDTMQYTADQYPTIEPSVEEWTKEVSAFVDMGPLGGSAIWNLPGEIIRGQESLPSHDDWHTLPYINQIAAREIYGDLQAASDEFLARQGYEREGSRYRCVRPSRDRIAVFCHGGFGLFWLAHLLDLPLALVWSGFWLAPSSVTTILFEQRSADWAVPRCIGLGDTSHLYAGGLPIRPRGILAENWFQDPALGAPPRD